MTLFLFVLLYILLPFFPKSSFDVLTMPLTTYQSLLQSTPLPLLMHFTFLHSLKVWALCSLLCVYCYSYYFSCEFHYPNIWLFQDLNSFPPMILSSILPQLICMQTFSLPIYSSRISTRNSLLSNHHLIAFWLTSSISLFKIFQQCLQPIGIFNQLIDCTLFSLFFKQLMSSHFLQDSKSIPSPAISIIWSFNR